MFADIVVCPECVAGLAGNFIFQGKVGRVLHKGQDMLFAGPAVKNIHALLFLNPFRHLLLKTIIAVARFAGYLFPIRVHNFPAGVTINAPHPLFLMDVRRQLMVFNPIWAKISVPGCVGCSVFDVEIMFETAVIIEADIIAVVAGEAVVVTWFDKIMRNKLTVVEREVTGSAAGAVSNSRVIISLIIGVAAKTSSSKQIVRQFQNCCRGLACRGVAEGAERLACAKTFPEQVGAVCKGKVQCLQNLISVAAVALAAALLQMVWVGRLGYKPVMGSTFILCWGMALMAGAAWHRMIGVSFHRMAVETSQHFY